MLPWAPRAGVPERAARRCPVSVSATAWVLVSAGLVGPVGATCGVEAREVMLSAASLTPVITGSWTTDRRRAAFAIVMHYPQWADQARLALEWARHHLMNRRRCRAR